MKSFRIILLVFLLVLVGEPSVHAQFGLRDPAFVAALNPAAVAAGGGAVTVSYLGRHTSTSGSSSYTFSASDLGAASSDRIIWLFVGSRDTSTTTSLTAATVSGIGASYAVATNFTTTSPTAITFCEAWYVPVPTGTSGDIVITFSEPTLRVDVAVYGVTGQTSFSVGADNTPTALTATVTGVSGGAIIAGAFNAGNNGSSWSGATEIFDSAVGSSQTSGATNGAPLVGSNVITDTASGGNAAMVVVSLSP